MADELYVLNEGQNIPDDFTTNPSAGTFNIKTSVNPRAVSINVSNSTNIGINCYEIHSDDDSTMDSGTVSGSVLNRLFPESTDIEDYADNIIENPGYRVTIDTDDANGLTLSGDRDYFVVIYADNVKKHHVAKITEQTQYDGNNYHFEFSPRLKENITVGTKVTIYQGPLKIDNVVAVGYGLLNDDSTDEERHDKYVDISRPTFYFYEGDKLDHDRKYTLLKVSTNFTGTKKSVFKTAPLSSDMIIDKGFFTHHGDLTDTNRENDNSSTPRGINSQSSQGSTYTLNRETWDDSSKNIYDSDGGLSTYITFIDSPVKNQIHSSPYYVNVNKTVTNKGNMATVKFFDVEKILDKKINTYERFKVKQFITEKKLDRIASSALPGNCTNTTSTTFTVSGLVAGEDWRKVLYDDSSAYEPVFIENYYYVISGITAPADGEQVVTVTHKRLLTANAFSSVGTLETFSAKKAYRKTWSPVSQTFLADHQIDTQIDFANAITRNGITVTAPDSDINGIEYILEDSKDSVILEVDKGDKDTGYTKITSRPASNFFSGKYLTDSITGKLIVNNPIFDGFVETKKADVKQAFKYEIVGRDSISKLLNTSLDRNYVHSDEFVYTTFNPYVGDATNSTELSSSGITISSISGATLTVGSDPTSAFSYGDVVALRLNPNNRYVTLGVVSSTTSTTIVLMKDSYITDITNVGSSSFVGSNNIYKVRKSIIPSKNLETTTRITNRATSIAGTLDKGIVFGGGRSFNSTGDRSLLSLEKQSGIENGFDIDSFITPIVNSDGKYLDFPLGFKTELNIPASTPELNIINTENNTDGSISYEIGYVSPIVLGMVTDNRNDVFVNTTEYTNQPIRLINGQGLPDGGFLHLLSSYKNSDNSPKTFNNIFSDDPAYSSTVKSQYSLRHSQPIFRYANLHVEENMLLLQPYANKYSLSISDRFTLNEYSLSIYSRNDYYENTKNFNFYLSTYKLNRTAFDYDADNSDKWMKGLPKEQTGILPALGSKFFDITRVPDWYHDSPVFYGNRFDSDLNQYVGRLELHDPSAISLHLFSLGDVYPESKTNHNNIFYTGRNLDDYSIIFKRKKTPNNENSNTGIDNFSDYVSPLQVNVSSRRDEDYHVEPISSSNGDKTRFNLMRLTDLTLDMLFNEVDYENYNPNNNGTEDSRASHTGQGSDGVDPCLLIKTFPQAGMHNVDVKVTTPTALANRLTVTSTSWYQSEYEYYIYYYSTTSPNSPTLIGEVSSVSGNTIIFSGTWGDTQEAADVADTVLYVKVHHTTRVTTNDKNKMLLTKDSVVPYYPEETNEINHNYNKTVFFANSDYESDNASTAAKNTFQTTQSDTFSSIVKTPMFIGKNGTNSYTQMNRRISVLGTPSDPHPFKMTVNANVSGNTITLTDSNSKLTDFFKNHIETKIGTSRFQQYPNLGSWAGVGSGTIDGNGSDTLTFTGGVHDLQVGQVIRWGSSSSDVYVIIEVPTDTTIKVSPNHNSSSSITATSSTFTGVREGIFTAQGQDEFFIQVSGLTNGPDNRLYKVVSNTDTTLTLKLIGSQDGTTLITPSLATENGVDITIQGFSPSGNALLFTSGDYDSNWVTDVNGRDEPRVYSHYPNSIIPHRAYNDSEDRLNFNNLDTVVAAFYDVPEMFSQHKSLPQEIKNHRGASLLGVDAGNFTTNTNNIKEVSYVYKGTESTHTLWWNKVVMMDFATASEGIMGENYNVDATTNGTHIYAGEIFFRPYIKVTSSMRIDNGDDDTLTSTEEILKFDLARSPELVTKMDWLNYCNNLTGCYFYNENNDELHKVISHEINRDETNVFRHLIKIDNTEDLNDDDILRPMRINQVCMYDFSPKTITLNSPKIEYTKVCGEDKMQLFGINVNRINAANDGTGMIMDTHNNGVKSMYVFIDPDGKISSDFLETRNSTDADIPDTILPIDSLTSNSRPIRMNANDGINSFVTSVSKRGSRKLQFSEVKKLLGTPSFGTTFTITVSKSPPFVPTTACIGASFKIVDEIESAINDAFTINDISYTQDTEDDKYYGAFNFTGQSLYSAANNILSYKNKEILVDGEEIKIVDKEDEKKYRNIVLSSKNSDFQITSISNDVSLLDNFDEVIVIGDGVRGIARNPISTTDANRTIKTKEIYDYSILDQRQADLKAIQYLDVFNTANTSIEIEVADNVPFLKPGHIIELEFEEQNIPRGDYLVIETEKEFGRPTKFILSEYSKDLAGTFSLLLGEIRNLQGFTKQKVYTSTTIPRIKRDKVNIKFVKSTATLTSGITTTSTIGFGYTIGFDSEVGV